MTASMRRRSLLKEEHLEKTVTRSAEGHQETGPLGSLCRQFQRRLPLRAVSLNLGTGPSWKRLETPEPEQQGLQAAARSAKSALGAMSQRIQESCQSGTKWLMQTQVKVRRKRGAQKDRGSPPSLSQKNTRLYRANRDARVGGHPRLSGQMGPHAHRRHRLRREAALQSPCSSTEPLCSPRQVVSEPSVISLSVPQVSSVLPRPHSESDSDLEPVGAGIQHLQKLSQKLDKAIKAEESGDMTVSLIRE
ncbi:protein FAM64A-like protein [Cricetulus griseus]|nr:protein FAM64A-like protein [Cricetulus griseus]